MPPLQGEILTLSSEDNFHGAQVNVLFGSNKHSDTESINH